MRPIAAVRQPECSGSQLNSRPNWRTEAGNAILSPIKSEVATRGLKLSVTGLVSHYWEVLRMAAGSDRHRFIMKYQFHLVSPQSHLQSHSHQKAGNAVIIVCCANRLACRENMSRRESTDQVMSQISLVSKHRAAAVYKTLSSQAMLGHLP